MTSRVLAIESSCDETAAAVVEGNRVLSSVVRSQIEVHEKFGGVVPELASRHHLGAVVPVVDEALSAAGVELPSIDAFAVTEGPGLMGALLVGVQMARGLALATDRPLVGVHHMEGHLWSAFLGDDTRPARPFVPHLALLVSGGHTELVDVAGLGRYEILGATRDDAAGEAYDKVAKMLGLGYPGGPAIDRLAAEGCGTAVKLPRAMADRPTLDFSFSGLKTAVRVHVDRTGSPDSRQALADLCASFQAAVVDVLVLKALRALRQTGRDRLHIVGGVAANRGLREAAAQAATQHGFTFEAVPMRYCGDNAAMIGAAAAARFDAGVRRDVDVHTSLPIDDARMLLP
ncbi:MAG: tRNA (adenosine(37)-N6)-threonylcarbamoyltransferase complex transferase subunit TsaD [Deltaproteobacteria bacterium]|nr:tRNA (adenosine(37)-N6)-threonylcarbamoyltransferase complex transferase subunit TsaD [Deltaproteobacteria bacterium]